MTRDLDFSRIHRFVFDDLHLMLDVNSGSIHVTDETVDAFLDKLEGKSGFTGVSPVDAFCGMLDTRF